MGAVPVQILRAISGDSPAGSLRVQLDEVS